MKNKMRALVIVGSAACGKTALFNAMYRKHFRHEVFSQGSDYALTLNIDGITVAAEIFDTTSVQELTDIRRIVYFSADVILLVFSIDDRVSLDDVETKWCPELRYYIGDKVPIVLVGNKTDLRSTEVASADLVGHLEGLAVAKKIRAHSYLECSAESGEGVINVFKTAAKASFVPKPRHRCVIL